MTLLIVLSTFPSAESARAAARALVEESLAACVNIIPGVESIYQWEGKMECSTEVQAIIKTSRDKWPALEKRLLSLHPYAVPEIVALTPAQVTPAYLNWVMDQVPGA